MAYSHISECPQSDGKPTEQCICPNGPFFYCSCGHPGSGCYCP